MFKDVPAPSRPAIPAAFVCFVAALCAQRMVLAGAADAKALCGVCGAAALLSLVAWRVCVRLGRQRCLGFISLAGVAAFALAVGGVTGGVAVKRIDAAQAAVSSRPVSTLEITLGSDMSMGSSLWRGRAVVRADGATLGEVWLRADRELPRGATLTCVGRFTANADDEWGVSARMQGVCGTVRAVRLKSVTQAEGAMGALLAARREVLASVLGDPSKSAKPMTSGTGSNGEGGSAKSGGAADGSSVSAARAIVAGIVCGYGPALKQAGVSDLFSTCGISHMAAVSGSHLVVVTSLAGVVLKRMKVQRWAKALLLALFSGTFVAFCGFPPSAVRSWAMSLIAAGAPLAGRRGHTLSSVSVAGLAMCLGDPTVSGQLGFLLSVACVGGIALFGGYSKHVILVITGTGSPRWARNIPEKARVLMRNARLSCVETLSLTLVCQAASLPLSVPAFGVVSLIAPVTNLLVAPFFAPYLALGLLTALAQPLPQVQGILLTASDAVGRILLRVLEGLASIPCACIALEAGESELLLAICVLAAALLIAWPKVTRARIAGALGSVMVFAAVWLARWRFFAPARICVMDVGQADAILVTDGAASMMVDAGVDDAVRSALSRNHVQHLDAIVLTHLDQDHVGGLDNIVGTVQVGRVLVAKGVAAAMSSELEQTIHDLTGRDPEEIAYGDVIRCGGFRSRVVWPTSEVDGDENADSVELAVTFSRGGASLTALLTGDGERDETASVVAAGDVGDIDFLKVGHHGSAASINAELSEVLKAGIAVASAGEGNRYGHPRAECVEALESAGSEFLCTKDVGDVTVYPGADGPSVSCGRRSGLGV